MHRYLIILLSALWIATCAAHNEQYYMLHPASLQKVLDTCNKKHFNDASCQAMSKIASRLNQAAFDLQSNPQAYGKAILSLQQQIATLQSTKKMDASSHELEQSLQRELAERLAVVKWLESPKG